MTVLSSTGLQRAPPEQELLARVWRVMTSTATRCPHLPPSAERRTGGFGACLILLFALRPLGSCGAHRVRAIGSVGGENLGLLLLELISGDDTALPQVGQLGELVRGTGRRARGFLDVTAEGLFLLAGLLS